MFINNRGTNEYLIYVYYVGKAKAKERWDEIFQKSE